ncbi:MAG TPA: hypothetical protein VFE38_00680 [Edaphobacter sp.]|nr:hypothetical protein [Edaphobacter sp.]
MRSEGVVAARAEDSAALLTAVSRVEIPEGAVVPSLKTGNIADRASVIAAVRQALNEVTGRAASKSAERDVTLIVPDAAVRVLLLDFDQLPSKAPEAMPVVRFRLKKLLPFDAETAAVSYQMLPSERGTVRVLTVAMPGDVLAEYESVVTAAGYLPGAVLPGALAALAGLEENDAPILAVNAELSAVTTAIVKGGNLLLHRTLDLSAEAVTISPLPEELAAAPPQPSDELWEESTPGGYDRFDAAAAIQTTVMERAELREKAITANAHEAAREVTEAVSVAAAYFEDTLGIAPDILLSAGTIAANQLSAVMEANGLEGLQAREMFDASMIEASAVTARVPWGWMAGVRGALKG